MSGKEIARLKLKSEKWVEDIDDNTGHIWDVMERSHSYVIRFPERRDNGAKALFKAIMAKNFKT